MIEKIPDSVYASEILNDYRKANPTIVNDKEKCPFSTQDEIAKSPWKEVVKEELTGMQDRKKMLTGIVMPAPKSQRDPIMFTIVKWLSAGAPIYIPFILCMIFTGGDILISVFYTLAIDLIIIIALVAYVMNQARELVK